MSQDYLSSFKKKKEDCISRLESIQAVVSGKERSIDINPVSGWVEDQSGKAAHLAIEIPPMFGISGKLIIGVMHRDYQGEAASFGVKRVIHVVRGIIKDVINGQVVKEDDGPYIIKVNDKSHIKVADNNSAVIVIDLQQPK